MMLVICNIRFIDILLFPISVLLKHNERISVKKDSFFHDANITLSEGLKITYWWSVKNSVKQVIVIALIRLN